MLCAYIYYTPLQYMCSSVFHVCVCVYASYLLFHCFTYLYVHMAAHASPLRLSTTTIIVSSSGLRQLWSSCCVSTLVFLQSE